MGNKKTGQETNDHVGCFQHADQLSCRFLVETQFKFVMSQIATREYVYFTNIFKWNFLRFLLILTFRQLCGYLQLLYRLTNLPKPQPIINLNQVRPLASASFLSRLFTIHYSTPEILHQKVLGQVSETDVPNGHHRQPLNVD